MTVSVLCPTLNAASYLRPAIESLLAQSMTDFEVLILDGGSTDQTRAIFDSFRDDRLQWLDCREHHSLAESLNLGISQARGEFLMRQDADDVSVAERMHKQVLFLKQNLHVALIGSNTQTLSASGAVISKPWWTARTVPLNWDLIWGNQLIHSSVMMRKKTLQQLGLQYEKIRSEDYRLWCRLAEQSLLARSPEVLVYYRMTDEGGVFSRTRAQSFADAIASSFAFAQAIAQTPPPEYHYLLTDDFIDSRANLGEIKTHLSQSGRVIQSEKVDLGALATWLQTVFKAASERWQWDVEICEEVQEDIAKRLAKVFFLTWSERSIADYKYVLKPDRELRTYSWMVKDFIKIFLFAVGVRK